MAQFAVIHFSEGWRVLFDGQKRGRFSERRAAIDAALRLAHDVRRQGRRVELLVQDDFGEVRALATGAGRRDAHCGDG